LTKISAQDYRAEISAHEDVLRGLAEQGKTLLESLDTDCDNNRQAMADRLGQIDERWRALLARLDGCRQRLDEAQEQWQRLAGQLRQLLDWLEQGYDEINLIFVCFNKSKWLKFENETAIYNIFNWNDCKL